MRIAVSLLVLMAALTPEQMDLARRDLRIPVEGVKTQELVNTFDEKRGSRKHEALDILAPRGTPVVAAGDGTVVKLFTSAAGGLTVYQFDPAREFCYYYAHLDCYAKGLTEGMRVKKGDRLGEVGTTGNAPPDTPHLHFAVFKLGPEKQWWKGTPVNPFPVLLKVTTLPRRWPDR